ncbi:MAG: alpha-L-fucosidase, partial [Akkermansiaceae bacterium]|nr:alpha-L-fucosidase [Verrucomicrobiales bacterium]
MTISLVIPLISLRSISTLVIALSLLPSLSAAQPSAPARPAQKSLDLPIVAGPFQPTTESLKTYKMPEWFRDAKFGIWSHWGPQAVPRQGDWYARHMYLQGHPHYEHHLKTYGHPSRHGYKDIIPLWKAEQWE